jgi:hypothetical protein
MTARPWRWRGGRACAIMPDTGVRGIAEGESSIFDRAARPSARKRNAANGGNVTLVDLAVLVEQPLLETQVTTASFRVQAALLERLDVSPQGLGTEVQAMGEEGEQHYAAIRRDHEARIGRLEGPTPA